MNCDGGCLNMRLILEPTLQNMCVGIPPRALEIETHFGIVTDSPARVWLDLDVDIILGLRLPQRHLGVGYARFAWNSCRLGLKDCNKHERKRAFIWYSKVAG